MKLYQREITTESTTGLSLDTDGSEKEGAMSDEDRQPDEADKQQAPAEEPTDSGRLSGTFISARQAFGRSFDRLTGAEFRRQFEEFSNVVTSTVLGIYRDQSELSDRLAKIEQTRPSTPSDNKLVKATFVLSLVAMILGIWALQRTL